MNGPLLSDNVNAKQRRAFSSGIGSSLAAVATLAMLTTAAVAAPTVSGQLYVDFDRDGNPYITGSSDFDPDETGNGTVAPAFPPDTAGDAGSISWADFSIQATDAQGNVTSGSIDPVTGAYTIDLGALAGDDVKIEFIAPGGYQSTYNRVADQAPTTTGDDARPLIWHLNDVSADIADQHVGFVPPSNCSPEGDVFVTCYVSGDRNLGSTTDAMVRIAYDASGKFPHSSKADIGATWGVAQDEWDDIVFSSAYLVRSVDLGPEGLDGLYWSDAKSGAQFGAVSLGTIAGGISFGSLYSDDDGCDTDGNGSDAESSPPTGFTSWEQWEGNRLQGWLETAAPPDCEAYGRVGKVGVGDIDTSPDGNTLLVTNLAERMVMSYDVVDAANGNITYNDGYALTNPGCASDWYPFALETLDGGKALVGITCTDSSNAYIVELDIHEGAPFVSGQTTVETIPLDYTHACANGFVTCTAGDGNWQPWKDEFELGGFYSEHHAAPPNENKGVWLEHPQPILSDISVELDGSLTVGIRNRFPDQIGWFNPHPYGDVGTYRATTSGDILKVCNTTADSEAPAYALEGDLGCMQQNFVDPGSAGPKDPNFHGGPGGLWEWYGDDRFDAHPEISMGGTFVAPRYNEALVSVIDPLTILTGGIRWFDVDDGSTQRNLELYQGGGAFFSKGQGLGDVEGCYLPVEIGNRVWYDANGDGVQDPGEIPLQGVKVKVLDADGNVVAEVVTDANGYWKVDTTDGLIPINVGDAISANDSYTIEIDPSMVTNLPAGLTAADLLSTRQDASGDDELDSDLNEGDYTAAASWSMTVSSLNPGDVNHEFDAGFYAPFDQALKKTIKSVNRPFTPGSVTFLITVENQGAPIEYIEVSDYIDTAMWQPFVASDNNIDSTFSTSVLGASTAANDFVWYWDDSVDGTPTQPVAKIRARNSAAETSPHPSLMFSKGETLAIEITLRPVSPLPAIKQLENFAEISEFDNDLDESNGDSNTPTSDGTVLEDADSSPDDSNRSSSGETPRSEGGVLDDNSTTEDALANPGVDDEDDHDIAIVPLEYDLALIKRVVNVAPIPATLGSVVTYEIMVMNQGEVASGIYSVADDIPAGMVFNSASPAATSDPGVGANGTVEWDVAAADELQPDETATFQLKTLITNVALQPFRNSADITADSGDDDDSTPGNDSGDSDTFNDDDVTNDNDPGDEDDSDFELFQVTPVYDLALIKKTISVFPNPPDDNSNVTYRIKVRNQGNIPSGSFTVTDVIPTGMTFVSATPAATTDPGVGNGGSVSWVVPAGQQLAPSGEITFDLKVNIADVNQAPFKNIAEITADSGAPFGGDKDSDPTDGSGFTDTFNDDNVVNDNDPGDEDDSDFEILEADIYDLALIKELISVDPNPAVAGSEVTFEITVMNQGNLNSGTFTVSDLLPSQLNFKSASPAPSSDPGVGNSGSLEWVVPVANEIVPGEKTSFTVVATLADDAAGTIKNIAEITADSGFDKDSDPEDGSGSTDTYDDHNVDNDRDANDQDDSDFAPLTIPERYDLSLIKTLAPTQNQWIGENQVVNFLITVKNQGNVPSGNFSVVDSVPGGMVFVSASGNNFGCNYNVPSSRRFTCDFTAPGAASLPPDGAVNIKVKLKVRNLAKAPFKNWAEISADSGDDIDSDPNTNGAAIDLQAGQGSFGADPSVDHNDIDHTGSNSDRNVDEDDSDPAIVFPESTTPITLQSIETRSLDDQGSVEIRWVTSMEDGNNGFYLYARNEGESWRRLNQQMVLATAEDDSGATYSQVVSAGQSTEFAITDVDLFGSETVHGPFRLGETYGTAVEPLEVSFDNAFSGDEIEQTVEPSPDAVYLYVREAGIHRVSWNELQKAGYNFTGVAVSEFALTNSGQSVPIRVEGARNADDPFAQSTFGQGGFIEFVGEKRDSIYSDMNVYRLSLDSSRALRIEQDYSEFDTSNSTVADSYQHTEVWGPNRKYSRVSMLDDPWYAVKMTALRKPVSRDFDIELSNVDQNQGGNIQLHVWAANDDPVANPDHHVVLHVNGVRIGGGRFEGLAADVIKGEIDPGTLKNGTNTVKVTLPVNSGAVMDQIFIDRIELTHARRFKAEDGVLSFDTDASMTAVQVRSLTDRRVVAYRTDESGTWRVKPRIIERENEVVARFAASQTPSKWYVTDRSGFKRPEVKAAPRSGDIFSGPANYLVIAHPRLMNSSLERLLEQRASEGYSTKVVNVRWLYDHYTDGNVDAEAIRKYIADASTQLGTQYVVLVGGDSYDYKNNMSLKRRARSLIPTIYGETGPAVRHAPVDPLYGDVDGDGLPEVMVGRLAVQTSKQLDDLIAKILDYPFANHGGRAVIASDGKDDGSERSFKMIGDKATSALSGWSVKHYALESMKPAKARERLIRQINSGAAITGWIGHSDRRLWGFDGVLRHKDVVELRNGGSPTIVLQWGCWNTYYVDPRGDTMAHRWLSQPGVGAAAVIGATTLTEAGSEDEMARQVFAKIAEGMNLGQAVRAAKSELIEQFGLSSVQDLIGGFVILGDPTMKPLK